MRRRHLLGALGGIVVGAGCSDSPDTFRSRESVIYPLNRWAKPDARRQSSDTTFDDNGVIQVDYDQRRGGAGVVYNPITIAIYGRALYRKYLDTGAESDIQAARTQGDWLVANQVERNGAGIWVFPFDRPAFNIDRPWVSGLGQGYGIGFLLELHSVTGNDIYLDTAQAALQAFTLSVENWGVKSTDDKGRVWYQEVAKPGAYRSHILNGFIFALAGLYLYYQYTGDLTTHKLFKQGVASLRHYLPKYDADCISLYHAFDPDGPARIKSAPRGKYNLIHTNQLLWLYSVMDDPRFLKYALRFYRYESLEPFRFLTEASAPDLAVHSPIFRNRAWTAESAQTWVEFQFPDVRTINAIWFAAPRHEMAPTEYELTFRRNGSTVDRVMKVGGKTPIWRNSVSVPPADTVRMEISQIRGGNSDWADQAGLYGVRFVTPWERQRPVVLSDDRLSLRGDHPPRAMVARERSQYWTPKSADPHRVWVDCREPVAAVNLNMVGDYTIVTFSASDDLQKWRPIDRDATDAARYYQFKLSDCRRISSIEITN